MRPVLRTLVVSAVVLIAVGGGFAGGYLAHSGTSPQGTRTLAILAAGSLAPAGLLPALADEFAGETPGVAAPISAQLYEGSSAAATALASGSQPYDVFVSADFRIVPQKLEPPASSVARWEVVFAADPLVLAFDPNVSALSGINETNWAAKVLGPGVILGAPNASADPLGANGIVALELEDALQAAGGAFYAHFFSGTEGGFATPTSAVRLVPENTAATALATGEVGAYFIYRSYAVVDHLSFVALDPHVSLGGTSASNVAQYANASTTVLSGAGTRVVQGAPILFSITVPTTAPDAVLGTEFAAFLLSNSTSSEWTADGFVPIAPAWTDQPSELPAALSGTPPRGIAALPSYLTALLA